MTSHAVIALPLVGWGAVLMAANLEHVDYFVATALVALCLYMVTLCAVASFYAKDNAARKGQLAESMAIGRTVQDFLLPANGVSKDDHLTYLFRYSPHGGGMSGDWLKHWRTDDGAAHFLIGDVTGKGPQAALTVAMVMSVVSESILTQEDAGACMRGINRHLHRMFHGKIVTAAAAASVYPDGRALIYNAAALGWCVWNEGRFRHHLGRSSMLGLHPEIELAQTWLTLRNGDHLMALTDGVASHPRSLRRLLRRLADELMRHSGLEALGEAAMEHENSSAIDDDRALVAIRIGPTVPQS
jgi:serine phosphatase RsbU (regulator of sigma subunit)